jgi:uncharacterized membrane-anchored protein
MAMLVNIALILVAGILAIWSAFRTAKRHIEDIKTDRSAQAVARDREHRR